MSLEKSLADKLAERAEREGLSRSAYAKKMVAQALGETNPEPLSDWTGQEVTASLDRVEARLQEHKVLLQQLVSAEPAEISPEEVLAQIVQEYSSEPIKELVENLPRIHHEIVSHEAHHDHQLKSLRADLAKAVAVLLVNCGNVDSAKARAWVKKNLARKATAPRCDEPREQGCIRVASQ